MDNLSVTFYVYSDAIHNSQKVEAAQWPSGDEWRNQGWFIRAVKYYSVLKRKHILTHGAAWMKLVLSE